MGEKLIGWMRNMRPPKGSRVSFGISEALPVGVNIISVSVVQFRREFDRYRLMMMRPDEITTMIHSEVPLYAEANMMENCDVTRYSWAALSVTMEQYEDLFDHKDFEPVDTEPDHSSVTRFEDWATDRSIWTRAKEMKFEAKTISPDSTKITGKSYTMVSYDEFHSYPEIVPEIAKILSPEKLVEYFKKF